MVDSVIISPSRPEDPSAGQRRHGGAPLGRRIANIVVLVAPLLGLVWGIYFSWGVFGGAELGLLSSMYVLTVLGITVGYHRLFTHRSFETSRPVQCILAILGSMAVQGPLLKWVALHRMHHQHSDLDYDPHSPLKEGQGFANWLRGAWHAHIGWFFDADPPDLYRYVKDLKRSRLLSVISALFPLWVACGLVIPAALSGWITGTWRGALLGFLWGGLIRIFLVHHVTWSINSICHLWGQRTTIPGIKAVTICGWASLRWGRAGIIITMHFPLPRGMG